ncbi:MAG: 30S ribosomal protein S5 [Bacteroidia bacterium]|nr:30S ribosomal protein S5 [Bacteroidia bacterium]
MSLSKKERRIRIKKRVRRKIYGTSERPRMSVFRSNKHISVQIIDDSAGRTVLSASSLCKEVSSQMAKTKTEQAKFVGKLIAERALNLNIKNVVFDRNGYLYHGRVKALADVARQSGKVKTSDLELKDRLVNIQRVTKVTKGGRTFSFSAIVVVGNEDGIVGYGLGKAKEVTTAIAKGIEAAKKNLIRVPIIKNTIPHEQTAKFGGARVWLKPASSGTGVKAGGAMRAVLESVGIKNVLAKSKGSSNPHNLVKATMEALMQIRDANTIAQHRNVTVDKIFNG